MAGTTSNGKMELVDLTSSSTADPKPSDELEALAMAELLEESRRAQSRTSTMGALGWAKPPPQTNVNKRFLHNTLVTPRRDEQPPKTPPQERARRKAGRSASPVVPMPGSGLKLDESLEKEKQRKLEEAEKQRKD